MSKICSVRDDGSIYLIEDGVSYFFLIFPFYFLESAGLGILHKKHLVYFLFPIVLLLFLSFSFGPFGLLAAIG